MFGKHILLINLLRIRSGALIITRILTIHYESKNGLKKVQNYRDFLFSFTTNMQFSHKRSFVITLFILNSFVE